MNIENKFKEISGSLKARNVLIVACSAIVLLAVFQAGILVGYNKAVFSNNLGDNYYRAFGDRDGLRKGPSMMVMMNMDFPGGHGAVGKVIQVNLPTFIVASPDNVEKVVRINDDTIIRQLRNDATSTDLNVNDYVVVIGNPDDDGEIEAKFIRLMPPPSIEQVFGTTSAVSR